MSKTIYNKSAGHWVEAMPLGNGSLGAMVFFGTDTERIALNHDTLWSGVPEDNGLRVKRSAKHSLKRAKKLALEGQFFEAEKELDGNFLDYNSEKYLPLGDITLDFHHEGVQNYKRELVFDTASATCSYDCNGKNYRRLAFVSHPHDALVYKVSGESGAVSFSLGFSSPLKGSQGLYGEDTLIYDGECPGYSATEMIDDSKFEYRDGVCDKGISFRSIVKIKAEGGRVYSRDDKIIVENADGAIIYFVTETSFVSPFVYPSLSKKDYRALANTTMEKVCGLDFDKVYSAHIKDFSSLYKRVRLDLGASGREDMPTDERLIAFGKDGNDISLYTLLFDFARYLTVSASRKGTRAMNLQGIWNDKMPAPWRSNYTVNINTEMNYWPTLPSGLFECNEPMIELNKTVSKTGVVVAKKYYGAKGYAVHHNVDIWGHAGPVYWMSRWGFWCGGGGWLSRHLFEHYEYTLDEKFLKKTAYPIIKKAAQFYLDVLSETEKGTLAVIPSASPENTFLDSEGRECAVAKYTAMTNCIVRETLENACKCCEILGICDDFTKRAKDALSRLEELNIGSDGRILEWDDEYPEADVHHRHVSHLYALHPADMITPDTPELFEAARKTLITRGDDGTGWSLGWKINFYARLFDGNSALRLMKKQLTFVPSSVQSIGVNGGSGTYTNLFDAHPPFQIDGNFGFASGVYEMLARVVGDKLYLLPALPDEWKDGKIEGMRIKGNGTLDMEWRDGKLLSYNINCQKSLRIILDGKEIGRTLSESN